MNNLPNSSKDADNKGAKLTTSHPMPRFNQQHRELGKISSDSDGILMRLFRNICYDLTDNQYYSGSAWRKLMDDYLDDLVKRDPTISRPNVRGNFNKALLAPNMTWRTLCKALRFLKFVRFRIIIEGEHEDGSVTVHSTSVSFVAGNQGRDEANVDISQQAAQDAHEDLDKQLKEYNKRKDKKDTKK